MLVSITTPIFAQVPGVGPSGCVDPTGCDADRDGVPDSVDACPNVPGSKSNNGCPDTKPRPSPSDDGSGVAVAAIFGLILAGVAIAVIKAKAGKGKQGKIGSNLQQRSTPLRDYKSYSGPKYSQPSSPSTTSSTDSVPEPIKMDNGQNIEGVGITAGGPDFPKPENVKLVRTGNFTEISWSLPSQTDYEGRKLVGYEVYREIQKYSGGEWVTQEMRIDDPNVTKQQWENVHAEKFYGVKSIYRDQVGNEFFSIGVNPNFPNEV
ncbi:hypothetical protein [Nitrosopumilus sp. S6]